MNDLSQFTGGSIPATIQELKPFIAVGEAAVEAARRVLRSGTLDRERRDAMLARAQEQADVLIDAEMALARAEAAQPVNKGGAPTGNRNAEKQPSQNVTVVSDTDRMAEKRARDTRAAMLANPEAVEAARQEARENGDLVTRSLVKAKIREGQAKQKQAAHEERMTAATQAETAPEGEIILHPGERITIGKQTIICGDMREKYGIAPDIIFADPPYGMKLNADFSGEDSAVDYKTDKGIYGGKKYDAVIGDHDDFDPAFIERLLKVRCREVFLWGANYYAELLPNRNNGSWFVWDKRLDETADKMYGSCFELCWSREKHKQDIARVKWAGVFGTEQEFDRRRWHPTQKPVALAAWFLERFAKQGDIVLDPFCGAGFTLLACEQLGLEGIGIEISPEYATIAARRLKAYVDGRH